MGLLDKQNQELEAGATALQAGGDIIINNGLDAGQVTSLCLALLRDNFPKLQQVAQQTAEKHIQEFAKILDDKIEQQISQINVNKLADPDVQADLNTAIMGAARRGEKANYDLLSSLLCEKLNMNNDILDTLVSEAIVVSSKLSQAQIDFLSLICFLRVVYFENYKTITHFEHHSQIFFNTFNPLIDLSRTSIEALESFSLIKITDFLKVNFYSELINTYGFLNHLTENDLIEELKIKAPLTTIIFKLIDILKINEINLTPVGKLIGLEKMKLLIPNLNIRIWIN